MQNHGLAVVIAIIVLSAVFAISLKSQSPTTTTTTTVTTLSTTTSATTTVMAVALGALSVTSSNQIVDQLQGELLNMSIEGGTPPYEYGFLVTNSNSGTVIFSEEASNSLTSNSTGFLMPVEPDAIGTLLITANVVDSTGAAASATNTLTAYLTFVSAGFEASNSSISAPFTQVLSASVSGGAPAYLYDFEVYNSLGIVTNALWSNSSTSNTFAFVQDPGWGLGTFTANLLVTDSATSPWQASSSLTYSVTQSGVPSTTTTSTTISASTSSTTTTSSTSSSSTSSSSTSTTTTIPTDVQLNNVNGKKFGVVVGSGNKVHIATTGSVMKGIALNLTVGNVVMNVTITNQSQTPAYLPRPKSSFYQYIQINGSIGVSNIDNYVNNVTYNFSVPISWVQQENLGNGNIRLFKYMPSSYSWVDLPTTFTGSNLTSYFYSATSSSFSGYVVGFTTQNAVSFSKATTLNQATGWPAYYYAVASSSSSRSGIEACAWSTNTATVTISSNSICKPAAANSINTTMIGYSSYYYAGNFIAAVAGTTGAAYNVVISGIAVNVLEPNNALVANTAFTSQNSLSFTVATAGSIGLLLYAYTNTIKAIQLPAGCQLIQQQSQGAFASTATANCIFASSGTFSTNMLAYVPANVESNTIAAFIFPPYSVILNDVPSSGSVLTNGGTQSSGSTISVIGTSTANALAPGANYIYSGWTVASGAPGNFVFSSAASANTYLTVMGMGTLTATYTSTFAASPNPPLASNLIIDVGQYAVLNTLLINGNPPYTGNWQWAASPNKTASGSPENTLTATVSSGGLPNAVLTVNAYAPQNIIMTFQAQSYNVNALGTNTIYGSWPFNGIFIDSQSNLVSPKANSIQINPALGANTFYASSTPTILTGANQFLTANVNGGTSPYTFNYLVFNSFGFVTNMLTPGISGGTSLITVNPIQAVGTFGDTSGIVKAKDGYYYYFYANTVSNTIYYASSPNAQTWTIQGQVESNVLSGGSIAAPSYQNFGVGYDGNSIYVQYSTGTWVQTQAPVNAFVLTGLPNSGTITFANPYAVNIAFPGWYDDPCFANFSAPGNMLISFYMLGTNAAPYYYNWVYQTTNSGHTWTLSGEWPTSSSGYISGAAMATVPGTSNVIYVYGPWGGTTYSYRLYTAGAWASSDTTLPAGLKASSHYSDPYSMSLVGGASGTVYLMASTTADYASSPNVIEYTAAGWGTPNIIDHSLDGNPSITEISGSELVATYSTGTVTYLRTMPFSTGTWSSPQTVLGSVGVQMSRQYDPVATTALLGPQFGFGVYSYNFGATATVSNTFSFPMLAAYGTGTFTANLLVSDLATTPSSVPNTLIFSVQSGASCNPTVSNTLISFIPTSAGFSAVADNVVNVINTGATPSTISLYGTNWFSGATTYYVENTLWATANTPGVGTPLQANGNVLIATTIPVSASGGNTIWFGIRVPPGQAPGTYQQQITLGLSC